MEKPKIKVRKMMLEIFVEINDQGVPIVNWEYGKKLKCWSLIGILESVKKELLETVDDTSLEALE